MKFSVLMSVYAKEKPEYLCQSMQSLADQTLRANELVLIEDGSISYELSSIIDEFREKLNIKSVKFEQNCGLAAALNAGLQNCSHDVIARMDTDDICLPQRFELQISRLDQDIDLDIVGCFTTEIDAKGNLGAVRSMPVTHEAIIANMWTCPFIHPTVVFRRDKILALGGYNQALRRRQDYELWFRCAKAGFTFANLPESLLQYRFDRDTHKKQPAKIALDQALIGYKGASLAGMAHWKRFACFVPFVRSLLPSRMQHFAYKILRNFDPRQNKSGGY